MANSSNVDFTGAEGLKTLLGETVGSQASEVYVTVKELPNGILEKV